ncbi:redoxin domain-containing protein [Paractinoplanes atraurantiacus]|uniref:Peroxiredoxin n=1 Tax=Paractinoplanes atraurantiacus TaxID=1036182 RepID=A0A285JZ37_9ACTN|nr:redoxin domain-containing protein [Actinoplanes atraurantiacus]SNY64341.1 Peroxiredoxin [Actinoplanes atraurantiacus]
MLPITERPGLRHEAETFRLQLENSAIRSRMVARGDHVPDIPLVEADLGPIHLDRLRHTGPVVLVFFRHASSPACDAALRLYQYTLAPALSTLDAHLVAVSPQAPDRLEALKRRHDLSYLVASDPRHTLIDALNIGFASWEAEPVLGTGRSVLPFATVVVADRTGRVHLADVRADWTSITAPGTIIRAVRSL